MTPLRLLFGFLLLGSAPPGATESPAGAPQPDCREVIGGTGGAHPIRTVCPERDRQLAETGREMLRYRALAAANCASGVAALRNGGRIDRLGDYSCAEPAAPGPGPEALMDRIEAVLVMPRRSEPLASYQRLYSWEPREDGVRKVMGLYHARPEPGRRWVAANDMPVIMDGGCGVVTFTYDVATDRIEGIGCNGMA